MMFNRRRLMLLVVLIVSAGLMAGLAACTSGSSGSSAAEATPTPVPTSIVPTNPTYEVMRGDVVSLLQFSGRVAPLREQELFFKTSGYVERVLVRRNDAVQEGDVLAELEVTDLRNQITQREAELVGVQLDYERRTTEANNSVRAAELRLAKLRVDSSQSQIVNARINLERARTRLAEAQDEYSKSLDRSWEREDVREAYARGVLEAERSLEVAQAQYNDVMQAAQRTVYDIELAQMDLDLARLRLAEVEMGLDITRTVLSLDRLRDQLNDARIIAPFDGVILQLNLLEGRQVQGYQPQMLIADPTQLEVSAELPDSEMRALSEGMAVTAEFVNQPGQMWNGVIRRLPYPYGSGGRTEDGLLTDEDPSARIMLDGVDLVAGNFQISDRLRLTTELERSENTLFLPPQAVRTFEGRSFVVIQEGGAQRRIDVRVGIRSTDRLEILDGLAEGQLVIAP
jgi:multidrug efflux pump subunit AcrA (membrane-fusion protein)